MVWDLSELLRVTGATRLRWPGPQRVVPVQEAARAGPGDLYFPMYVRSVNDALFRTLAAADAAGVVLYDGQKPPPREAFPNLGFLTMRAPVEGYLALAADARSRSQALVVGITGSSGKSSTKEYLAGLLSRRYTVRATSGSHNVVTDCADILLGMAGRPSEAAVIEMGFGRQGDIERMAALARPAAGIITKVTADHLDGAAGSVAVVAQEKGRLGLYLPPEGVLAVHGEDPGCALLPRADYRCRVLTFGAGGRGTSGPGMSGPGTGLDARYEGARTCETGTIFTLHLGGRRLPCRLKTFGTFQAANATAAALVAHALGMDVAEIVEALGEVAPLPRRFQVHRYSRGLTIIDDTFSSSVDAAMRGLENASALAGPRHRVALLTGIGNLAERGAEFHREVGRQVMQCGFADLLLAIPDERTAAIREGALMAGMPPERIHAVEHKEALPNALAAFARPDTLIYCKTSQFFRLGPQVDQFRENLPEAGFEPLR